VHRSRSNADADRAAFALRAATRVDEGPGGGTEAPVFLVGAETESRLDHRTAVPAGDLGYSARMTGVAFLQFTHGIIGR